MILNWWNECGFKEHLVTFGTRQIIFSYKWKQEKLWGHNELLANLQINFAALNWEYFRITNKW